ncbi:arrestin domain-containing protein 2-like [Toxorhynchites rutilus septentrionalis]|uniref:arrestin domain-containing protein 2-like n=1 Tax=Toxorhynchites rutilus septentrionalis TaxID=329112 RepID=UPI00247AC802|nr:arrestin domain-containing protein 2-like [Toxorhynchites rutilus septentrionalis]
MVPPICDISFDDNSHGVYLAGQTLAGHVDIATQKAKKVKSVYLRITGQACVKWEDSGGTGSSVTYSGREDYIEHKMVFLSSDSTEATALNEGTHSFKFSYKLPPTSPTSFEGDFGYIRYTIRIVLERPWKYDLTYKIAFTVVNQLDLNRISPPLNAATVKENMRQYRCGLCRSGPLIMTVSIPMTGYVPGQFILVTVEVMNKSGRNVSEIKIKLRRQVTYISQTPCECAKCVFHTLVKYQCSGVDRNRSAGYVRRLLIPPESPSRTTSVIRIEYFVEVVANVSGGYASERVKLPIVIGTVPLANLSRSQEQSSAIDSQSTIAGSTTNLSTQFLSSSIQSLKFPHSFEESRCRAAINIQEDDEQQTLGAKPFTPRYPVYRFDRQLNDSCGGTAPCRSS